MNTFKKLLTLFLIMLPEAINADVLGWRGDGSGYFPDVSPPLDWGSEKATGWSVDLEPSNASPILVGGKLFLNEEPNVLICVDSETGEILWKREHGLLDLLGLSEDELVAAQATIEESKQLDLEIKRNLYQINRMEKRGNRGLSQEEHDVKYMQLWDVYAELGLKKEALSKNSPYGETVLPAMHPSNGYTTYTPTSDGKNVYACYGTGVVVAYDFEGNRLWHRVLDDTDHVHGGTVSPILVDGKLIVRFSDYVALSLETGDEIWRTPSRVVFGTSVVFKLESQSFLFTPKGEVIRVADGKKITEELVVIEDEELIHTVFSSPIRSGDHLYTVRGNYTEGHAYHFRIPDSVFELEADGLELVWKKDVKKNRYYASPLIHEGLLYSITENSWMIVLDSGSGELVYEHKIEGAQGTTYPSLSLAGNVIFAGTHSGQVIAIEPGRVYKEVGRSKVESYLSSPIFDGDSVYLRTREKIQAIH